MQDTRTVLDAVRKQASGDEKLLVLRVSPSGALVCTQANATMSDLMQMVDSFRLQLQKQIDISTRSKQKG